MAVAEINGIINSIALWLLGTGLRVAIILLLSVGAWLVLQHWLRGLFSRIPFATIEQERRARTVGSLARAVASVAIVIAGTLSILGALNVPFEPFLASAGVIGLAVAMGSQALVRDTIAGLFILAEDQFGIGDRIRAGSVSGQVERISLRATWLRDSHGQVHIVPNSSITVLTNFSKQWSLATVRLTVPLTQEPAPVMDLLQAVAERAWTDGRTRSLLLARPEVRGPEELSATSIAFELAARVEPARLEEAQRCLRSLAAEALRESDIALA